jgi:hypothetical protein
VESKESGPVAVPQDGSWLSDVTTHRPLFFAFAIGSIIKEIVHKDIIGASCLLLFSEMLAFAQVHVAFQARWHISLKAAEGLVLLDFTKRGTLVGTNGNDRAVAINSVNNVAETVEFC